MTKIYKSSFFKADVSNISVCPSLKITLPLCSFVLMQHKFHIAIIQNALANNERNIRRRIISYSAENVTQKIRWECGKFLNTFIGWQYRMRPKVKS